LNPRQRDGRPSPIPATVGDALILTFSHGEKGIVQKREV